METEKVKTKAMALAICVVMLMMAVVAMPTMADIANDNKASNEGVLWESGVSALSVLPYPPLPPGAYDIVYDTEPEATWGPILTSTYPQDLRVRFTPTADGQLVREARIAWAGPWGGSNQFEIHIVDEDTGITVTTPVITEPDPWDWKVYDVSDLGFYSSGDFYIELWAVDCEIGIYTDDTEPIYSRSKVNRGDGWYYPSEWDPSDFKIRAILNLEEKPAVPATIDIDPDTLNLKSNGEWLTAYIELPEDYTVNDIDVSTINLLDTIPVDSSAPTTVGDYDGDSIPDLMVKFDRQAVSDILPVGDEVEITVTGELYDGSLFEGSDTIRVIAQGKGK